MSSLFGNGEILYWIARAIGLPAPRAKTNPKTTKIVARVTRLLVSVLIFSQIQRREIIPFFKANITASVRALAFNLRRMDVI